MKRAIFLATAALLAMLILVPMTLAQGTTFIDSGSPPPECSGCTTGSGVGGGSFRGTTMAGGSPSPPLTPETGGSALILPAASLLLGSGILTYAIFRRR